MGHLRNGPGRTGRTDRRVPSGVDPGDIAPEGVDPGGIRPRGTGLGDTGPGDTRHGGVVTHRIGSRGTGN